MPIDIDLDHITQSICHEECYELLIQSKFNPRDHDSFISVAPLLKKLSNNTDFLAEIMLEDLKSNCQQQSKINHYSPQVIMLNPPCKDLDFFLRANLWPSNDNNLLKTSGAKSLFYDVPHDHNFNFLTVGYFGPGYISDYYEYDYSNVLGYPGEEVEMKFIERKRLEKGKLMLYRAHKDVHNQIQAESLSVTLNIMQSTWFTHLKPQYIFDEKCQKIKSTTITNDSSVEPLLHLVAEHGGDNGQDFLIEKIKDSPIEIDKFRSLKALINKQQNKDKKKELIAHYGLSSGSKLMRELSKQLFEAT